MEADKPKQGDKTFFYPLPPPEWFDGIKYLQSITQVVEIDENTGLQKIVIIKQ